MKIFKKIAALFTAVCISVSCLCISASASAVSDAANSVVFVASTYGSGTGFAVGKTGENVEYIVTNSHVVSDDGNFKEIVVYFSAKANKYMIPEVYYIDPVKDICVLKLPEPTAERKPISLCLSNEVNVGDTVYALGYPDYGSTGQNYETMDTSDLMLTKGIVSKKTRVNFTSSVGIDAIMSDVQISYGNSGGPMVNENGAVIGINTYTTADASPIAEGAFAITSDDLIKALNAAGAPYEMYGDAAAPAETDGEGNAEEVIAEPETENNNTTVIIVIAAAAVIAVAVIVIIIASGKKNKNTNNAPAQSAAPAPASGTASIICVSGTLNGQQFAVGERIVIGRNPEKCSVCYPVNTNGISGVHCEIRKSGSSYEIMDCGSSYGTFLGSGQKLNSNSPVQITNGTYFYLGNRDQMFQFKID